MTMRPDSGRPLAFLGLILTMVATAVLMWAAMRQLADLTATESQARSQLILDDVGRQVHDAAALGIPIPRLVGVPELFAQRVQESPDIGALALFDADEQLLWAYPTDLTKNSFLAPQPNTAMVQTTVRLHEQPLAVIRMLSRQPTATDLLWRWIPIFLCIALATALAAAEAAHCAHVCGPGLRQGMLQSLGRSLAIGDFTRLLPILPRRDFDQRLQLFNAELRLVNEQHVRLSRLIRSLRQTEPDARLRAELDTALIEAVGHDQLSEGRSREQLSLPYEDLAHWLGLLLGWLVWGLVSVMFWFGRPGDAQGLGPIAGMAVLLQAILPAIAMAHTLLRLPLAYRKLVVERRGWLRGSVVGFLVLGPAWVWPLATLETGGMVGLSPNWGWVLALMLALLCLTVLTSRTRMKVLHAA